MEGDDDRIIEAVMGTELVPDGNVITAYVLVVEYMDPDGNRYLKCDWTEGIPEWTRNGLLHAASETTAEEDDD